MVCRRRGWFGRRPDRAGDAAEHPAEHELMHRAQEIPVHETDVTGRVEHGGLADLRSSVRTRADLELQPEATWDPHLCHQAQEAVALEALDTPEVDRVADAKIDLVPAAAAQPNSPPQRVEQPSDLPEPFGGVPPGPAADAPDRVKRARRRRADVHGPRGDQASAETGAAPAQRPTGCEGVRPPGLGEIVVLVDEGA